ncbi:precursor of CEP14-like [Diospyros lotus]|uniref:precursor of CEP14-like n=1 Tax=Diospyros lotus TaxID=55363 RepID=UPI00224F9DA7|nr:precursor of CEP14-like [Diospyros lotus]
MARSNLVFFIFCAVIFASLVSHSHGRKLVAMQDGGERVPPPVGSLFLGALPKGTIPSSSPSKKGHAAVIDEELIARHLASVDRILQSVPSPGIGH